MSEQTYQLNENLYEGICFGGPMNLAMAVSRFPKGFLAVDKRSNKCWIYEWDNESKSFSVRDENPATVDLAARIHAAEGTNYDVLAVTS